MMTVYRGTLAISVLEPLKECSTRFRNTAVSLPIPEYLQSQASPVHIKHRMTHSEVALFGYCTDTNQSRHACRHKSRSYQNASAGQTG